MQKWIPAFAGMTNKCDDERWKTKDERRKTKDERRKTKDERRKMEDERWKMEDGRWKMEDGRWKMEDGRWIPVFAVITIKCVCERLKMGSCFSGKDKRVY